jgi:hypothetical protein
VPALWIVRANSTCLLVRHVREELGLVLGGERELRGLVLERAARVLDLLVLALDLGVLLRQLLRLLPQLLVGLLQLLLLGLELGRELLRLLEQRLGLHRRLDAVEDDADAAHQLVEEREVRGRVGVQRGQLDHRLDLPLEEDRQHDDVAGERAEQARADPDRVGWQVRDQHAPLLDRALAEETFAEPERLGMPVLAVIRVGAEEPQGGIVPFLLLLRALIEHALVRADQGSQLREQHLAHPDEIALPLQHAGEAG